MDNGTKLQMSGYYMIPVHQAPWFKTRPMEMATLGQFESSQGLTAVNMVFLQTKRFGDKTAQMHASLLRQREIIYRNARLVYTYNDKVLAQKTLDMLDALEQLYSNPNYLRALDECIIAAAKKYVDAINGLKCDFDHARYYVGVNTK